MLSFLTFLASMGLMDNDLKYPPHYNDYDRHPKKKKQSFETTGPFRTVYAWKQLDYDFPSEYERRRAIERREFIQENNLPLGIEVYKDKLFVTMPKWKKGIPATLAVLPRVPKEISPKLVPFPNWEYHTTGMTFLF